MGIRVHPMYHLHASEVGKLTSCGDSFGAGEKFKELYMRMSYFAIERLGSKRAQMIKINLKVIFLLFRKVITLLFHEAVNCDFESKKSKMEHS